MLKKLKELFFLKAKFAAGSLIATSADYFLYLALVGRFFTPVVANIISYTLSILINFTVQRYFVFKLERSARGAFAGAMLVSVGGLLISTGLIYLFNQWAFFQEHQYVTKLLVTGLVFFYNFYFKRYVFEKRFV